MNKLFYYLVYGLWYTVSLLPLRVLYCLSDAIFVLVFYVLHYRRAVVRRNLSSSFPEKSETELRQTERQFYRWFCDFLVESVKMMSVSKNWMKKHVVLKGTDELNECLRSGQSCALYLGHYCNWEWFTSIQLWLAPEAKLLQIYHPLENNVFDRLFLHLRQRMGGVSVPMNDTLREILQRHRKKEPVLIAYISDQVPHWRNIHHWCNFLHHDTPVLTGAERISRKMNHAVFYLDLRRVRRGYYEGEFTCLTRNINDLGEYAVTDMFYDRLEKTIRRNPQYWLWSHNRWKRTREEFNERFVYVNGKVLPKESVTNAEKGGNQG